MSEGGPARKRLRLTIEGLTLVYAGLLVVTLVSLEWFAEHWVPLAILTFAPPSGFLAPLGLLLPLAVWRRRGRALVIQAGCVVVVLGIFMTWRWGGSAEAPREAITVITHNIGQGNREAFVDSFPEAKPDIILLQDVRGAASRQKEYMDRYPAYRAVPVEPQFVLLTPHTVEASATVKDALWHNRPVAARFVVKVKDERIAIYSVHLPTPRRSLSHVFTGRSLLEMLWVGKAPTDEFPSYRDWLNARLTLARQLSAVFEDEKLPMLIGGDFNMPDHGLVYHTFARHLTDAHARAGTGWGMTFPGAREGKVAAVLGCWLRLDYWFAGPGWKAVECCVADDDHSQHRAVLARFARP